MRIQVENGQEALEAICKMFFEFGLSLTDVVNYAFAHEPHLKALEADEGYRKDPYKCTKGKTTWLIGRNMEANPITITDARLDCYNRVLGDTAKLKKKFLWFEALSPTRRGVVLNMVYNMGLGGFSTFAKTIKAIDEGDYNEAAKEMLNSRWAAEVKERAPRLAKKMRENKE